MNYRTITVRVTEAEYKALQSALDEMAQSAPRTTVTNLTRWLIARWLETR